jgi:hypothetical protein
MIWRVLVENMYPAVARGNENHPRLRIVDVGTSETVFLFAPFPWRGAPSFRVLCERVGGTDLNSQGRKSKKP